MSENNADKPAENLVEPEGVDAGSAEATAESPSTGSTARHGRLLRGDGPRGTGPAPDGTSVPDDGPHAPVDGDLVGAPDTDPQAPGQYAAPPGQDSGSAG